MNLNMLRDCKITRVENSAVAGTSTLTTDILNMQGFDSVMFLALLGDVTDTSVLAFKAFGNDTNDTVSPTEYSGSAGLTAGASNADNKMLVLDIQKPRDQYVYATLARGTANAVVDGILAIQYNSAERPILDAALDTAFIDWAELNDPASV